MRAAFTFSAKAKVFANWGALTQKRGFACASKYSARQFLAELTAAKLCDFEGAALVAAFLVARILYNAAASPLP